MQLTIKSSGKKKASMKVSDTVFASEFNEPLIHQVLTAYMAGSRSGSKTQKSRSDVRGGGRKPWRQKGLGRARAGTIRSPIWRGGGVTFAARPKSYAQKINQKMYRGAIRSILSELIRQERLILVDDFTVGQPRTSVLKEMLAGMDINETLIIVPEVTENLYLASRNLPRVEVISFPEINPYVLIAFETVIMEKGVIEQLEAWLS